ncbi:hypothetical protein [Sulfurimonas sp.]|jgi:hypothetical protein|uniref:hypothetical protein n=1 Tax=Sulfurimonas sp. TaxID=2022749 RepID=UPI0025D76776|nr:hypothetical protein [Sulfurimonas sp.]MBT5934694.1 hypothetical protein [Sulfurimonas sp.]
MNENSSTKDKSVRDMICSFEENQKQKLDNSSILVWDVENGGWRNINLNTLITLIIKDTFYKVVQGGYNE